LESATVTKVFFDVRNDSDALYTHYDIRLQGVEDVQLMENAGRDGAIWRKRFVSGLGRCIKNDTVLDGDSKHWEDVQENGKKLFAPERGGSYQVFNSRPLSADISSYCAHGVTFLPELRGKYWGKLNQEWKLRVGVETRARVASSQSKHYNPDGQDKALGPWK
jgi:exonuclease 3'-5' domain-containing protein 1